MDRKKNHLESVQAVSSQNESFAIVTKPKHLTDEALLELTGNNLSPEQFCIAEGHLAECSACRERLDKFKLTHKIFRDLAKVGLQSVLPGTVCQPAARSRREPIFPWKTALAAVGCMCVLIFLFYSRALPTVSASELLSNAVKSEDQTGNTNAFSIRVAGQTCARGRQSEINVSLESSARCNRALQDLRRSQWGQGNLLSAKTYAAWRNSLHRRHDNVVKGAASWKIETSADNDVIRVARLELRASDYHSTQLTLDFDGNEEINISEEPSLPMMASTVPDSAARLESQKKLKLVDDPSDLLEVRAWIILHDLNADAGWEAVVLREGAKVRVKAFVANEERKQEFLKAFSSYSEVLLDVHASTDRVDYKDVTPDRAQPAEDLPGLAEDWLKQQFPDVNARANYVNQVLRSSQQILGRASFLEKLKMRQDVLSRCSCGKDLSPVVFAEQQALGELQTTLSGKLTPLIGSSDHSPSRTINLAQAKDLDGALAELLMGRSSSSQASFDEQVQEVRNIL